MIEKSHPLGGSFFISNFVCHFRRKWLWYFVVIILHDYQNISTEIIFSTLYLDLYLSCIKPKYFFHLSAKIIILIKSKQIVSRSFKKKSSLKDDFLCYKYFVYSNSDVKNNLTVGNLLCVICIVKSESAENTNCPSLSWAMNFCFTRLNSLNSSLFGSSGFTQHAL